MAIAPTGSVSLSQLRSELGASGAISFSDLGVRRLTGQSAGAVSLSAARGSAYFGTSVNMITAYNSIGSPGTSAAYRIVVGPGVTIGSTSSGITAFTLGQFPAGSTITIDNYGSILAAGGQPNGGNGGNALWVNYSNQTMIVNNMSTGAIWAGGGAGGLGGTGGTGGTGGGGVYVTGGSSTAGPNYNRSAPLYYWSDGQDNSVAPGITIYWNGVAVSDGGGITYQRGAQQAQNGNPAVLTQITYYAVSQTTNTTTNNYTSGGAGGPGGGGGNGGRGQGFDGANASGAGGAAGAAGSAGGTNAGAGGQGGTGGTGGTGGGWGAAGSGGGTGFTGNTGAAGNNGAGFAGNPGGGGTGGGSSGAYLVKGAATVTFNNFGSIAGNVA
jgi:hypothetical protein